MYLIDNKLKNHTHIGSDTIQVGDKNGVFYLKYEVAINCLKNLYITNTFLAVSKISRPNMRPCKF